VDAIIGLKCCRGPFFLVANELQVESLVWDLLPVSGWVGDLSTVAQPLVFLALLACYIPARGDPVTLQYE